MPVCWLVVLSVGCSKVTGKLHFHCSYLKGSTDTMSNTMQDLDKRNARRDCRDCKIPPGLIPLHIICRPVIYCRLFQFEKKDNDISFFSCFRSGGNKSKSYIDPIKPYFDTRGSCWEDARLNLNAFMDNIAGQDVKGSLVLGKC